MGHGRSRAPPPSLEKGGWGAAHQSSLWHPDPLWAAVRGFSPLLGVHCVLPGCPEAHCVPPQGHHEGWMYGWKSSPGALYPCVVLCLWVHMTLDTGKACVRF